jgi:EF hand associated
MKMKQQTCWTILRYFKYDDKLQIKQSAIDDGTVTDEELERCKNVELTKDAIAHLRSLFDANASMNTQKLEESEIDRLFQVTGEGVPWVVRRDTHYDNGINYRDWLGLWQRHLS